MEIDGTASTTTPPARLVNLGWGRLLRREYRPRSDVERGLAFARRRTTCALRAVPARDARVGATRHGRLGGARRTAGPSWRSTGSTPPSAPIPGWSPSARAASPRRREGGTCSREAWRRATVADEAQRLVPGACALAEAAWLAGDLAAVRRHAAAGVGAVASDLPAETGGNGLRGPLLGVAAGARPAGWEGSEEPYRLAMAGEPRAAAAVFVDLGCPYDAADVLPTRRTIRTCWRPSPLDRLGAPAGCPLRARLREREVTASRRAPARGVARPHGLTGRQAEVLACSARA